ncbi:TonB-dependent siderophore receptor [Granulibacter bethesdensis]|uniref:TonB-dependent siderophore receptor n=1 Tax=Granulibacter bethesdensis TaxID=364410 RepID=UPI0015604E34|nr:TonB-dependent siderophore receptor [Granulibacter bethesdensis]
MTCLVLPMLGSIAANAAAPAQPSSNTDTAGSLPVLNVSGEAVPSATAPVRGYVAESTETATKTDTPLLETLQSVSVVTADSISARAAQSVSEALRYTSGMQAEAYGNDPRLDWIRIRGFDANTGGIYLNGMRFPSGVYEPYGLERIDVLKGPASVLYGQTPPGGLVNLVSKRPTSTPLHELKLLGGSFGRIQGQADMSDNVPGTDGKWSYRITALVRDAGTQVDEVRNDRVFVAPTLTWHPDADTTVTLLTHYQRDHTAGTQFLPASGTVLPNPYGKISSTLFSGSPGFDKYDRIVYSGGYAAEHRFNDVWTVRQNLRYTHTDLTWSQAYGLGLQADQKTLNRLAFTQNTATDLFTLDNQAQAKFGTGFVAHTVLAGVDYSLLNYSQYFASAMGTPINLFAPVYTIQPPLGAGTVTNQDTSQTGIYLQDQMKLWNRLLFTAALRHDWLQSDTTRASQSQSQPDGAFTYRVGLGYLTPFGLMPFVSHATSFQPILGTNLYGDPFKPSRGKQTEIGLKYQPQNHTSFITASAFDITQSNVQTPDPNNAANTIQTGEIRVRGFEVEANASLASGLNLTGSYTYLDPVITKANDGTQGNEPTGVPRNTASLWMDYSFQKDGSVAALAGLGFGGGVRYVGSNPAGNANVFRVPSVTLFDAVVHYDFGQDMRWRFAINASNLFDRTYVASCGGMTSCFYGMRRTVFASVQLRW